MTSLSECRIDNIAGLAQQPISIGVRVKNDAAGLAYTVCHRLAHLISRLETKYYPSTAVGAKWYLENVEKVPVGGHRSVVQPFVVRLRAALIQYEERYGPVSSERFAKMLEFSNYSDKRILAGQDMAGLTCSFPQNPSAQLSDFVSFYMWKQSSLSG